MSQELNQFIKNATTTESLIPQVMFYKPFLVAALVLAIRSGQILDMIKKGIFYKKPIDNTKLMEAMYGAENAVEDLRINKFTALNLFDAYKTGNLDEIRPEDKLSVDPRLFHAIVGIATESTELLEALKKELVDGIPMDRVNLQEECGDIN